MPTPADVPATDRWDPAPCGLIQIDNAELITAANRRMLERTGYDESIVGQMHWNELLAPGSRLFYQTQLAPILELNGALDEVMLDLLTHDGAREPALMNAVRITDADGRTAGAQIAVMSVPDRRAYETELRQARARADQALAADAATRRRLDILVKANTALASSSDIGVVLDGVARLMVAELADWCVIYSSDPAEPDQTLSWAAAHSDPAQQSELQHIAETLTLHVDPVSVLSVPTMTPIATDDVALRELYPLLGLNSALVVPSTARGQRVATLIVVRGAGRAPFTADDLSLLTDVGARTGMVLDNVRRQHHEHRNSVALQQALLTEPRITDRLRLATRYLPATLGNDIGGDWYDAFLQPDGSQIVVIGDVVGHDIQAAAAMGQLRAVIRTIGYTNPDTPATILARTDETARALGVDVLATAFIAHIATDAGGQATLTWANAGHPPPVVIDHHGSVRLLDTPADRPLGIRPICPRRDHTAPLATGDTVVLYTDGLIERTDQDIEEGITRLRDSVAATHEWSLHQICDALLAGHHDTRRDDIALLVLRLL